MEITTGLRDLLIETAESLSGAERHRSWQHSQQAQLGQRQDVCMFGWGGTHFARPATRSARALPARMPSACEDASR